MRLGSIIFPASVVILAFLIVPGASAAEEDEGFVPLFNGENLDGWTGGNYSVEDGLLVCPAKGGGFIRSEKEYADFIFRFEFRLPPGGNNGAAIRTPQGGHPSRDGMEIQILDDYAERYARLSPAQFHGSIYGVVPAKRGALKPAGEWNSEEILAEGSHIRVTLNDQVIVDANLDEVTDEELLEKRPGVRSKSGSIGFIGHGSRVEFRNITVKELERPDNVPPPGFAALFNGEDLTGWKGLVANPPKRAAMTPEELAAAQEKADQSMREHWSIEDGVLVFDGKGQALCTAKDYGDFELLVDWKIDAGGDSGIYLRGSPQVQIWDREIGSGGLFNNKENPKDPTKKADNPPGEWNTFRITMVGEKVTVYLNDELVVDNVTMENYWEREKPIYSTGQIELQNHSHPLYFKNVFIREIPRQEAGQ